MPPSLPFRPALEVFSLLQATLSEDKAKESQRWFVSPCVGLAAPGGSTACSQQHSRCCSRLTTHFSLWDDFINCLLSKQPLGLQPPLASPHLPSTFLLHFVLMQHWVEQCLPLRSLHCFSKTLCSPCLGLFHGSPIPFQLGLLSSDSHCINFLGPLASPFSDKTILSPSGAPNSHFSMLKGPQSVYFAYILCL